MGEIIIGQNGVYFIMAMIAIVLVFQSYLQRRMKNELKALSKQSDMVIQDIRKTTASKGSTRESN